MNRSRAGASDIAGGHWLLRSLPAAARPYATLARLDRPIGTWLLLFPGWWALALAMAQERSLADPRLLWLFALGALAMRGAGCIYNDLLDRDFDAKVARTATRPIPSGQVSPRQAVAFMALLLLVGLLVLMQLNDLAILVGLASIPLVLAYPFMKRITYWPQAWLGLTFNWGALAGWAAAEGTLGLSAALLYAAGIFWTLGYDTIYAHQDKEDDALVGVKSTALRFGAASKPWLAGFYALAVLLLALAASAAGAGWTAYIGVAAVALHFAWQIATLEIDDPANCLARFKSNQIVGWIFFLGLAAGAMT